MSTAITNKALLSCGNKQPTLRMRMHEQGEIELAEISLDCHWRFARFPGQVWDGHICRGSHGNQIPLRDFRDQPHGLRYHRLLPGFDGSAHGNESSLEIPGSRRLCGRVQHL